jgi:hypothetical protein
MIHGVGKSGETKSELSPLLLSISLHVFKFAEILPFWADLQVVLARFEQSQQRQMWKLLSCKDYR